MCYSSIPHIYPFPHNIIGNNNGQIIKVEFNNNRCIVHYKCIGKPQKTYALHELKDLNIRNQTNNLRNNNIDDGKRISERKENRLLSQIGDTNTMSKSDINRNIRKIKSFLRMFKASDNRLENKLKELEDAKRNYYRRRRNTR